MTNQTSIIFRCKATFIVVCIVAWEGMPKHEADKSYRLLIHKLNKFGLPTTRRCATNENRTCACQGNEWHSKYKLNVPP